jgi:hypothetical protein
MSDSTIIAILEKSASKHGADTPLTIGHLLNILKMADREREKHTAILDELDNEMEQEAYYDYEGFGDRS